MSARLKIDVLLKETIKLNLLRLVERLEHQHVWARLQHSETHQFIFYLCGTQTEVGSSGQKSRMLHEMPIIFNGLAQVPHFFF